MKELDKSVERQEIDNCSLPEWYYQYKDVTIPTIIIPLSDIFVDYLKADSVFIPGLSSPSGVYDIESSDSSDDSDNNNEDEITFPDLDKSISDAILELGGSCFPKLNWSSPKDAAWVAFGNTLECKRPSDIYILLKSSDFIIHDLCHSYQSCVDNTASKQLSLGLREWMGALIDPALEFRCFVNNNILVGISQRDTHSFFPLLLAHHQTLEDSIMSFFIEYIQETFPSNSYTFDVYCTSTMSKVRIIDFNPFCSATDSLLFNWSELLGNTFLGLRCIECEENVDQPLYAHNRLPKEVFDFSANGSSIAEFVSRFNSDILDSL